MVTFQPAALKQRTVSSYAATVFPVNNPSAACLMFTFDNRSVFRLMRAFQLPAIGGISHLTQQKLAATHLPSLALSISFPAEATLKTSGC